MIWHECTNGIINERWLRKDGWCMSLCRIRPKRWYTSYFVHACLLGKLLWVQFWFQTIAQIICVAWKCFVKWAAKKNTDRCACSYLFFGQRINDWYVTVMMIPCILEHEASILPKLKVTFVGNNKDINAWRVIWRYHTIDTGYVFAWVIFYWTYNMSCRRRPDMTWTEGDGFVQLT